MSDTDLPATYRVVPRDDGKFAVEVSIEGTNPTMVTSFVSESAADEWITAHRARALLPKQKHWRTRKA